MLGTLFIALIVAVVMLFIIGGVISWANAPTPEQIAEKERQREQRQEIAKLKGDWLAEVRSTFQFLTSGRLVDGPYTGRCVFAFDAEEQTLRVYGYTAAQEFKVQFEANIPVSKIISVDVVRPMEMKRVQRTQAVGMVSTNKKSPVARGLAGGAVLGPAGLILGAASGASKDVKTEIKEHKVWERVQMEGDPQLLIGTSDPATPLIKIKPEKASDAEEWLYRIRAVQTQSGGALQR